MFQLKSVVAQIVFVALGCVAMVGSSIASGQTTESVKGINISDGFVITRAASDDLATNVFSMTVSPKGETFVSGPGYIKALIDSDGNGVFDAARIFAAGPASGAQGMCFDGNDLLCTGDGGLLRFVDANGDGIADGPPEVIMPMRTGSEHHSHAIRKGPDGWWYVLAGNQTGLRDEYYSGKNSPVTDPRAGFLMRVSPDWSEREIVAHGFRNAYDFDFDSLGQIYVYDSDGERDITLPWYRPTRLFRMRAGDDAGWVDVGWKRPSDYLDMPPEMGALGRGSPTGVVTNSYEQFPVSFNDAIFVADWTFGRVIAFRRDAQTGEYDRGTNFAIADGQFGFAVTDMEFAPDGSLLVSVGGRGTQGAIYRISFSGEREDAKTPEIAGREFVLRTKSNRLTADELISALSDPLPRVRESAMEALIGRRDIWGDDTPASDSLTTGLVAGIRKGLETYHPQNAGLVLRLLSEIDQVIVAEIDRTDLPVESKFVLDLVLDRTDVQKAELIGAISESLASGEGDVLALSRLAQLALGGCGANEAPQMFKGYTARSPVAFSRSQLNGIGKNLNEAMVRTTANTVNDVRGIEEIARLTAMLQCRSDDLLPALMERISDPENSVAQSIHWLNCLSQLQIDNLGASGIRVADVVVGIGDQVQREELNTDRNFYPRLRSLVAKLLQSDDGQMAGRIANSISGQDHDVYLFNVLPESVLEVACSRFANWVEKNGADATAGQMRVIGSHPEGKYLSIVRRVADRGELLDAVVSILSKTPAAEDREIYFQGLASSTPVTVKNSAIAIRRILANAALRGENADGVIAGLRAAKRMGWDNQSVSIRDQIMLMLRSDSGQDFGYTPKQNDVNQTDAVGRWVVWAEEEYPSEYAKAFRNTSPDLMKRIEAIDWSGGDVARGQQVYKTLQCAQCHDLGSRLGPRLEGIARRFGRDDLVRAIVTPSDQVPDRYRSLVVETVDGQLYRGTMIYESVDGITLQESTGNTVRLNSDDIENRALSPKSLMPEGLLDQATDQNIADLFAFLRSR